jgi:ABC-type phosphate/phosphonate transport system substrate-binding protein
VASSFGRFPRSVGLALVALVLCLPDGAVDAAPAANASPAAKAPRKLRRVELRIGIVPFNDPRNPLNTTAEEETSLRTYFKEVERLQRIDPVNPVDLDIRLVKGSYYQILHWMREGQLDGAVVSSFTAYLLMKDPHLALLPVIEFARNTSRPMFSVRGTGAENPRTTLWNCLEAVQKSLKDSPPVPPCEFRFVSHLSTTGFVVPLIYIEEQFVRTSGMSLLDQQAFWTRLLQWSRLDLLHGVVAREQKAETSVGFTYIKDESVVLPVKDVTNLADVLLLGCRRNQPDPLPESDDARRGLLRECASDNPFLGALATPEAVSPWEKAGAVIQASRGYVRTTAWSRAARDEFARRIESVFLPARQKTALRALFTRWYDEGRYEFSIDEVIDVLKVDQVIRKAPRAALVLPGGGVRATYQSVILDHLYAHRIVNAGIVRQESNDPPCPVTETLPVVNPQLLVINGIAGTSGGALLGYFASRRDTRASKALTELWIDDQLVKTTALDIFPAMGALRVLSLLLLVAVFAATSAVLVRRERSALKGEVPFWYTTFLSIFIIASPFFIWRTASDPKYMPTFEAVALFVVIMLVHFIHSVSVDGPTPSNYMRWRRRGIALMAGGFILAIALIKVYESIAPAAAWKRTLSALWTVGATVALILIMFGLSCLAAARGLRISSHRLHEYREALLLLLLLVGLSFAIFGVGWWMRRVTPLEMTIDYWVWVFVAAVFSTKLIITAERVYGNVPLLHGIRFLSSPSGTAPFPYTPAVTLVIWGTLGIVVWLTFVASALYSSERGRNEFDTAAEEWKGVERVPLIVSMTGLGDDVKGYRSPPYRGDYYAVDKRWCFVDELQGKTSAHLFPLADADFKNAVFASGSPFPIYPATKVQAEPGAPGLFVDGGFAHRVPIEAAGLVSAAQILIVENVARVDVPSSTEGFSAGALPTNAAKVLDFLFERSQTIDGQRARSAVVATIYPDWSPPNPFLMDFRESVVQRLRAEAEKDLEGHRVGRIESWGEPKEEGLDDGT